MEEVLLAKIAGAAYGFKSLHESEFFLCLTLNQPKFSDFLGLGFQVDCSQILPLCISLKIYHNLPW